MKPAAGIKDKKLVDSSSRNVHLNNMQTSISEGEKKINQKMTLWFISGQGRKSSTKGEQWCFCSR